MREICSKERPYKKELGIRLWEHPDSRVLYTEDFNGAELEHCQCKICGTTFEVEIPQ